MGGCLFCWLPSFAIIAVILTVPSLFFCTFSCNNGYVLADETPTGLLNSYILQHLPTSQNSAAIISYFAIKIFFRCSGSSNFLFLLCYSEWEFFLLQGFRDFPNKQAKMSVENCKNEKVILFAMLAIFQNVTHFPVLAILQICFFLSLSFSKFLEFAVDCKQPVGYSNRGDR